MEVIFLEKWKTGTRVKQGIDTQKTFDIVVCLEASVAQLDRASVFGTEG